MPGRIIAQMATKPLRKINHGALGVVKGISPNKKNEDTAPRPAALMQDIFHFFIVLPTVNMEDKTRPKKKDQTMTGWLSNNQLSVFARDKIADKIPRIRGRRKGREADKAASFSLIETISLRKLRLKERIVLINFSYIPSIRAIVPPDTPGTTSAAPMQKPLRAIII